MAAAAREKLSSATRDRALQLERKRKAAAFLKLKSVETDNGSGGSSNNQHHETEEIEIRSISRVDDRVHTISDSDKDEHSEKRTNRKVETKSRRKTKDVVNADDDGNRKSRKLSKKRKSHKR